MSHAVVFRIVGLTLFLSALLSTPVSAQTSLLHEYGEVLRDDRLY